MFLLAELSSEEIEDVLFKEVSFLFRDLVICSGAISSSSVVLPPEYQLDAGKVELFHCLRHSIMKLYI